MADPSIIVTGPTASGKTDVAIRIAEMISGEIISADSGQVYQHLDIGTAKPSEAQRGRIRHYGMDLIPPNERYSAGRFVRDVTRWSDQIRRNGSVPIVAGGAGFFLYSLFNPPFQEPWLDPVRREALAQFLSTFQSKDLLRWLFVLDPTSASKLEHWGGRQRIVRALELTILTGKTIGWWHAHAGPECSPIEASVFVLEPSRADLYSRIDARVDEMLRQGLVHEVRKVLTAGYTAGSPGLRLMGYRQVVDHLLGIMDERELQVRIKREHRRLARMQLTWLRNKLPGSVWLDAALDPSEIADRVVRHWRLSGSGVRTAGMV